MRITSAIIPLIVLCSLAALFPIASEDDNQPAEPPTRPRLLPLAFEENRGQVDDRVDFIARGPGYTLYLASAEAVMSIGDGTAQTAEAVRIRPIGGAPEPSVEGLDAHPGTTNYLVGNDPSNWIAEVPTYARVAYRAVYPGVDMVFYGRQGQLEYDFVLAPGANPDEIKVRMDGADAMRLDAAGDLVLNTPTGEIRQCRPVAYQEVAGQKRAIACSYEITASRDVAFNLGDYDASSPLVIDPVLIYSTYMGGSDLDGIAGIALDDVGNVYVAGTTGSVDFPVGEGLQREIGGERDAFVMKLDPTCSSVLYATYLGGADWDVAQALAIDAQGNAYVSGTTYSADFPIKNAFQPELNSTDAGFVTKINATGSSLIYSTYFGSHETRPYAMTLDDLGHVILSGMALAADLPTKNAVQPQLVGLADFFVAKLASSGEELVFSTYFGGHNNGKHPNWVKGGEYGITGLAVDPGGNIYIAGDTNSWDFPTTPGAYQEEDPATSWLTCAVAKFNPAGEVIYSTYLGQTWGGGITAGPDGCAYVRHHPPVEGFPGTEGAYRTPEKNKLTITRLDPTGSSLVFSTGVGVPMPPGWSKVVLDAAGNVHVAGSLRVGQGDLPPRGGLQAAVAGESDAVLIVLNASGSELLYWSYLGGSGTDQFGQLAVDPIGDIHLTGHTTSLDFPTVSPLQGTFGGGGSDAFLVKMRPSDPPFADAGPNFTILSQEQASTVLNGVASDDKGDALTCRWLEGEAVLLGPVAPIKSHCDLDLGNLAALSIGDHAFTLEVSDGTQTVTDVVVVTVENSPPVAGASGGGVFPLDASSTVTLGGQVADYDGEALTFEWRRNGVALLPADVVTPPFGGAPIALPNKTISTQALGVGTHTLVLAVDDGTNTEVTASITVQVIDENAPTVDPEPSTTILWPPNHQMVEVTIDANAVDDSGLAVTLFATVQSSEPPEADGDGNFLPDHEILSVDQTTGEIRLNLRTERSGRGDGRTYTVQIRATDAAGNVSTAQVTIKAPHDRKGS